MDGPKLEAAQDVAGLQLYGDCSAARHESNRTSRSWEARASFPMVDDDPWTIFEWHLFRLIS
jgi:hypothetical protein